ncbi:MAG: DNA translocase FtsK [Pseudomonadota bacterium]
MSVPLTVSQVRKALYRQAGVEETGSPCPSTPLLGRLFHEILKDLVGPDRRLNWLGALSDAEPEEEEWKRLLKKHTYRRLVGPRLIREQSRLQQTTEEVLHFWRGVQALSDWMTGLLWTARRNGLLPETIQSATPRPDSLFSPEVPVVWEISREGWLDKVRLTGVADLIVRRFDSKWWAVVEIKLGRGSEIADFSQACLYHLMFSSQGPEPRNRPDVADVVHFQPEPMECLVKADQIEKVKNELIQLIGRLAGVLPPADNRLIKTETKREYSETSQEQNQLGGNLINIFKEYGVSLELASEPILGPAFLRFPLLLGEGVRLAPVQRLAQEVQMRLSLETTPLIHLDQGQVVIDLQRPDRQTVLFSQIIDQLPQADRQAGCSKILLGADLQGRLQFADLTKPEHAHLLAAGTTGSGKSEWLLSALAGLVKTNTPETLQLILIDPKRTIFNDLRGSPFLYDGHSLVYPDESSPLEVLNTLVDEMESRYKLLEGKGGHFLTETSRILGKKVPRIVCFCDEYYDLIQRGRKEREALEALIFRLGAKARAAGIHLVLATQQPSRQVIKGALDANIPARLGFKTNKAIESKMLLNTSGAENLLGKGDFLFKDIGDPIRLQAPLLTPELRKEIFSPT